MAERLPSENSNYQNAVLFISEKLKNGEKLTARLVSEASEKNNLTPLEGEMLVEQFKKPKSATPPVSDPAADRVLICETCGEPVKPKCKCN